MSLQIKIAIGSIGVSILVLAIKTLAWWLTGSVALYSDALESIVNVATAFAALIAIKIAALPPDAEHPYGHNKAEYMSAVIVGVLIIVASIEILREAYASFLEPTPIAAPVLGLSISMVATVVNAAWGYLLIRKGREHRSPALESDGKHLMADVVTSIGVLVGVVLVVVTQIAVIDAVIAAIVAIHVLWNGWEVLRDSASGLLDESVPKAELDEIRHRISHNAEGALEVHALRTRHAGRLTFIDFHLIVPGEMSTRDSHAICDRIETALRKEIEGARITIHVEPDEKAKATGVPVI